MSSSPNLRAVGLFLVIAALVTGCGSGGSYTPPQTAPSGLSYSQASISAVVNQAIAPDAPSVTGTVNSYAVSPSLPAGLSLDSSTGKIAGTPTTAAAEASYTVTGSNSAGSTTAKVQITVAPQVVAPSGLAYAQATISATVGQAIAADTPMVTGTVTSYSANPALPAGLTIDPVAGTISGTPTAVASQAAYTVTAANSAGSTTAMVQIAVAVSAPPPGVLQYEFAALVGSVGLPFQQDNVEGNYAGVPATTFTINPALPTGLLISSTDGEIVGTPTAAAPKTTYTVTATNSNGVAIGTVQLTVNPEEAPGGVYYPQATINAYVGEPIAADVGNPYYFANSGPVTSFSVNPALPAGLNLSQTTGTIAGTPTTVTPSTTYTVIASNAAGSTPVTVQIAVGALRAPTALVYPQTSIATYTGQAITPDIPGSSGGPIASFSISPPLPAGLSMNPATGIISGTPTAASPHTNYVVTGTNAAGSISSANTSITLTDPPMILMHVGSSNGPLLFANGNVLSGGESRGPWTLWNYQSGAILASGDAGLGSQSVHTAYGYSYPYETNQMAGPIIAISIPGGIEVLSSADGHLLGTIASPGYTYGYYPTYPPNPPPASYLLEDDMWQLASDGSYISIETQAGLYIYAPNGQLLFSSPGDYLEPENDVVVDSGIVLQGIFAAPGQVLVANGPGGANAIETVTVPDGISTVASPYQGQFYGWFGDGSHFFTQYGYFAFDQFASPIPPNAAIYVYTSSTVQQQALPPQSYWPCLGGWGNWIWNSCQDANTNAVSIYAIGSTTPALTYSSWDFEGVAASGPTLAVLPQQQALVVFDLSGSTPVETDYSLPPFPGNDDNGYTPGTYAAESASKWVVDLYPNGILDGPSVATSTPRYIGSGAVTSVGGSTDRVAIATGGGPVTWFDPSNATPQGSINLASGEVELSTDGTVLAAGAPGPAVNIYSLPAGTATNTLPYPGAAGDYWSFALSGSGMTLGTIYGYGDHNGSSYTVQVTPVSGGSDILSITQPILNSPVAISPDGTLVAVCCDAANNTNTLIYKNGTQVAAVPGQGIGWIDNGRLLVNQFVSNVGSSVSIYSSNGTLLATPPLPADFLAFQTVTPNTIYIPSLNAIYSLTTGQPTWTSPYHADGDSQHWGPGAVAGQYVVFESEGNVIAVPY